MTSDQQRNNIRQMAEKVAYCLFWQHHLNTAQGYDEWQLVDAAQQYVMRAAIESGILQMPDVSQDLYALVATTADHHQCLGVQLDSVRRGASTLMRQSWCYEDDDDLRLSDDGDWILSHEVDKEEFDSQWVWQLKLDDCHQPPFKLIVWTQLDCGFDPYEIRVRTECSMDWSGDWQMLAAHLDRVQKDLDTMITLLATPTNRNLEWFA